MHTRTRRGGFTLVEVLVSVGIIAILSTIGLAAISSALRTAKATKCLGNLHALGTGSLTYAADNDGALPQSSHQGPKRAWTVVLKPYVSVAVFKSPLDDTNRSCSYAMNDFLTEYPYGASNLDFSRLINVPNPSETFFMSVLNFDQQNTDHFHFADSDSGYGPTAFSSEVAVELVNGAGNYLFVDAHVERLAWTQVRQQLTQPGSRFVRPDGQN